MKMAGFCDNNFFNFLSVCQLKFFVLGLCFAQVSIPTFILWGRPTARKALAPLIKRLQSLDFLY